MTSYIIDITRFISRIGKGYPTGIDRVEIEYIKELNRRDPHCLALAKMGSEFCLVPSDIVVSSMDKAISGLPLGRPNLRDAVRLKLPKPQRAARSFYRKAAIARSTDIKTALSGIDCDGAEYLNVGHSNLSTIVLEAVRRAGCAKISVMVHDMIPLDYPQFTRDGVSVQFERKMKSVAAHADQIICNSSYTSERVKDYFSQWNSDPDVIVAHLGVEPFTDKKYQPTEKPYFVVLGTIEPRKNHQLLFEVWNQFAMNLPAEEVPELHIIGKRGWMNEQVFQYLDTSPLMGKHVFEASDIDDLELEKRIGESRGLLFPSHVEGFGLPALEAAQKGIPVLCSNLPVFREILGSYATYLNPTEPDEWMKTLLNVAKMSPKMNTGEGMVNNSLKIPRWASHFRHVFGNTGNWQDIDE